MSFAQGLEGGGGGGKHARWISNAELKMNKGSKARASRHKHTRRGLESERSSLPRRSFADMEDQKEEDECH